MIARGDAGIAEVIAFVVVDTRSHLQDLAQGHAVIAAGGQLRQIPGDRVIDGLDPLLLQCDPDENGDDRLRHGEGDEAGGLVRVVPIGLVDDASILHDEQCVRVGTLEELLRRVGLAFEGIREVERVVGTSQVPHGS